ncbi:polysaccharide deacetylase family protein [Streptomyces tubbatahanensis]|uniref:Polysaccharide deacetylase family protein n=1 Tax=Streptomyces tubbatahanensis TaxID=2923272 RepID=A0ABY3Y0T2_9ACTN|nr:polysaccharide deacetylase family protein [Streptomyces tubbatahanensis]UNT00199.1 polysaccharide deacetylase family protein [Streptomyces tubbatahanensis]
MHSKRGSRPSVVAMAAAAGTVAVGLLTAFVQASTQDSGAGAHPGWDRSLRATRVPQQAAAPHGKPKAKPHSGARAPRKVSRGISHHTEKGGRTVALTLDDGPHPEWTPKTLDLLREYHVKATFCLIGPNAERYPKLVQRIVAEGHRLCDHSVDHDTGMDHEPVAYQERQILDAKKMIDKASGGAPVYYYRAPGGAFTPDSRRIAAGHGMRPLGWIVDPGDWQRPGADVILRHAEEQTGDGAVILFHDGGGDRSESYEALRQFLPWLKEQGYGFGFPKA